MLIKVDGKQVTVESVDIQTDPETGRRLALLLFALATKRPGYGETDARFTCTVPDAVFSEVIRISGAQRVGERRYTFRGKLQNVSVEGSFETSGCVGVIREAG